MLRMFVSLICFFNCLCGSYAQSSGSSGQLIHNIKLYNYITCSPVQDQSLSPTCWAFGSMSLFEADIFRKMKIKVNLSEMFIARYAYIDKARQFLHTGGKTYAAGGGQFHDVIRVIEHYGLIPEVNYSGRVHGEIYHNHNTLDTGVKRFLYTLLNNNIKILSQRYLKQLNDTLDKYLGRVPEKFKFQSKMYTPKTFASNLLHFKCSDYRELVSFDDKPYYQKFMLADKYNWAFDSFYNIHLSDLEKILNTALAKGVTVGWEGDVTEEGFNYFTGFATLTDAPANYDSARVINYVLEKTERDHMLHVSGVGTDTSGRKWYYMKNSWGETNFLKGYLFMQPEYVRLKTVILVLNKNALPQQLKSALKI